MKSKFGLLLALVFALTSCRGASVPLTIDIRADKQVYLVGDKIAIEAIVRNLRHTPIAYNACRNDLFVYPLAKDGKTPMEGVFVPQPDGSEDTIALTGPRSNGGMSLDIWFVNLGPLEEKVFTKEYVAKRPGRYKASYKIFSRSDIEYLPDPNYGQGTFGGGPRYEPKPWVKQRKVPNVWIGSIPEKHVFFEITDKK